MPPKLFPHSWHQVRGCWRRSAFVLLLLLALPGCHNTCVTFTSNPPEGKLQIKVGDPPPPCEVTVDTAPMRVEMIAAPTCAACPAASRVEHVFVTLNGVSGNANERTATGSSHWQELAPQLAKRPVQVNLLGPSVGSRAIKLGEAVVPAGVYRQIRLQLLPKGLGQEELVSEKNACGSAGVHCLVMADGRILPLGLEGAAPQWLIPAEHIEGGFLRLLPDTQTVLKIAFQPSSRLMVSADGAHLLPVFTATSRSTEK